MSRYEQIVWKYLWKNKVRTIVTMFGMIMATILVMAVLTMSWSTVENYKQETRFDTDYDATLLLKDKEEAKDIAKKLISDGYISKAFTGSAKNDDDCVYYLNNVINNEDDTLVTGDHNYEIALYITSSNPYNTKRILEKISDKYGIDGYINNSVASYYGQGEEGSTEAAIIAIVMLICSVLASFGVIVLKNTLKLSVVDKIKDYGVLRCVGISIRQIKRLIFLESMYIGMPAILFGGVFGYALAVVLGSIVMPDITMGISLLPIVLYVLIVIGSMFFSMIEPCEIVSRITPVEAINAQYKSKHNRFKRGKSIFYYILGIEGDYAYKNLIRNKGRFIQLLIAYTLAVTTFIAMGVLYDTQVTEYKKEIDVYADYQTQITSIKNTNFLNDNKRVLEEDITKTINKFAEDRDVQTIRKMYESYVAMDIDIREFYDADYRQYTTIDEYIDENNDNMNIYLSSIVIKGYGKEDMSSLEKYLMEGSLNLGDHEIAVVNYGKVYDATYEGLVDRYIDCKLTNLKVGDTINILDKKAFDERASKLENVEKMSFRESIEESKKTREEMLEAGEYSTYTVKALLSKDLYNNNEPSFIVGLDNYYNIANTTKEDVAGYNIKYNKNVTLNRITNKIYDLLYIDDISCDCGYVFLKQSYIQLRNALISIGFFMSFIILIGLFNVININIGNMKQRQSEFASLQAIGISKKRLIYITILEGIILAFISWIIGSVIGSVLGYCSYSFMAVFVAYDDYKIPWLIILLVGIIVMVVQSVVTLFSVMSVPKNIAGNLSNE